MGPPADSREGPRHVREPMSTGETVTARQAGNGGAADGTPLLSLRGVGKNFGPLTCRGPSRESAGGPIRPAPT